MRNNIFFLNKQLGSFIKKCNGRSDAFFFNGGRKNYRFGNLKKIEQKGGLYICQKKYTDNHVKSNNVLFFMSLFCISLIINQKFHDPQKHGVKCMSENSFDKKEKLEELEKVFLLNKNEIKKGEMIEVKVNDGKDSVLLINVNNMYYCVGSKCPHYSAPLHNGFLTEKYVTCPWHDAKFDIQTGECLNGPSFEDIPSFKIEIEGDKIYAYLPKKINVGEKKKICSCKDRCERNTILIVGGGAAALGAIETFLKNGFSGRLIVCSKDSHKPYDRTTISKNLPNFSNTDELYEAIKLKPDEYYNNNNITYINDVLVTKIDHINKKAFLNNGDVINFDKVLIASGLSPRPSPLVNSKNASPDNLFNVYNLEDSCKISSFAKEGARCVILGSSFIGCEIASALRKKKVNVSMVTRDNFPLERVLGEKAGSIVLNVLKENNVNFYGNVLPTEYIYDNRYFKLRNSNIIHGVKLNNGETLGCDFVVESIGCIPNTNFLEAKFKNSNNFIVTDKYFRVKDSEDMYAAGDVCVFPYFYTNEMLNICHWNVAIQQGRIAAHNMLNDKKVEFRFLPFFNTNIMGNNFRISGFASMYDKVIYEGDLSKKNFVGFFVKNDKVISVMTLGNSKMPALNECLTLNKVPKPYELEAGLKNSDSMIESIKM